MNETGLLKPSIGALVKILACLSLFLIFLAPFYPASAAETDQFLTWEIELGDCSDLYNVFLNDEIQEFLDRINRRSRPASCPRELTRELYLYFFQGLHSSRVRAYLRNSDAVDRYPGDEISPFRYQRMSIHRGFAFPYILPMARTIRMGEVYFGIDKIGHFFGFGRRYFQRYWRHIDEGMEEEAAMERVVRWGIHHEENMVGKLVDGIFSHGDLEANFQGFLMARTIFCGPEPHIVNEDGFWRLARPVDILPYITPDLDESYNTSHYWAMRKRTVLPILKAEYCDKRDGPIVRARFERYAEWKPSFSKQVIKRYFEERGRNPQREQSLEVICAMTDAELEQVENP